MRQVQVCVGVCACTRMCVRIVYVCTYCVCMCMPACVYVCLFACSLRKSDLYHLDFWRANHQTEITSPRKRRGPSSVETGMSLHIHTQEAQHINMATAGMVSFVAPTL